MRKAKRLVSIGLCTILLLSFFACGKKGNGNALPAVTAEPVGTGTVADSVVVLSQEESQSFINLARPVEVNGNTMVVEVPAALSMQQGEIFMVRPTANNPYGFMGKVEAVNGNQVTVCQPLMDEVFESMNIDVHMSLAEADIVDVYLAEGVTFPGSAVTGTAVPSESPEPQALLYTGHPMAESLDKRNSGSGILDLDEFVAEIDCVLYDRDGDRYGTTNDQLHLIGKAGYKDANIDFSTNFNPLSFDAEGKVSGTLFSDVKLSWNGELDISLNEILRGKKKSEKISFDGVDEDEKLVLYSLTFDLATMTLIPSAGEPIIAALAGSLQFTTTISGKLEGEVSVGYGYSNYFESGFKIVNYEYSPIKKIDNNSSGLFIEGQAKATARATAGADIVLYLLGIPFAKITNDIGLFIDAEGSGAMKYGGDSGFDGSINIVLGFEGWLKIKMTAKIFGNEFTPIDKKTRIYNIDILKWTYPQADAEEKDGKVAFPLGFSGQTGAEPPTEYYLDKPLVFEKGEVMRIEYSFTDKQGYDYGEEYIFLDENNNVIQSFFPNERRKPIARYMTEPFPITVPGVAVKVSMDFYSSQGNDVNYDYVKFIITENADTDLDMATDIDSAGILPGTKIIPPEGAGYVEELTSVGENVHLFIPKADAEKLFTDTTYMDVMSAAAQQIASVPGSGDWTIDEVVNVLEATATAYGYTIPYVGQFLFIMSLAKGAAAASDTYEKIAFDNTLRSAISKAQDDEFIEIVAGVLPGEGNETRYFAKAEPVKTAPDSAGLRSFSSLLQEYSDKLSILT